MNLGDFALVTSNEITLATKPLAISLFSGAGGMDLGVLQAGYEILACVENDPHCCETLRTAVVKDNRKTRVLEEDIRNVAPLDLMAKFDLIEGELDLLCGGPPCQAFSQIGKQASLADERGLLLFEMVRFARDLKPKAIMIEQVKGLLSARDENGKRGGVFEVLLKQLQDELGYSVKWATILAADYGVPQLRQRVFIVATRKGVNFDFPDATHVPLGRNDLFSKPYITVGEALKELRLPSPKSSETPTDSHMDITTAGDKFRIHGVPEGGWLSAQLHLPIEQRKTLTKKDTTKFRRLSTKELSLTLRCGEIFFHPVEDRVLTPREYMRLHGYPDDYLLKGPIRSRSGRVRNLDQHRQVANSVPPPVGKAIAEAILRALEWGKSSRYLVTQYTTNPLKQKKVAEMLTAPS